MALGGGTFLVQNKILPGAYINFISAKGKCHPVRQRLCRHADRNGLGSGRRSIQGGRRRIPEKFIEDTAMTTPTKPLRDRDLFKNAKTVFFYKLNTGGAKAKNAFADALYTGSRGNELKTVVEPNERYTDAYPLFDVNLL